MFGSKKKKGVLVGGVSLLLVSALILPALANHPEVSLPGSNFEIDTNANLKLDDPAPSEDWASIPQGTATGTERRAADTASGPNDESFGQGTKEDTQVPTVVDGSIPPNKSDLLTFGGYLETVGANKFLNIYWHRVQEPNGTTNMDFEFNKSSTISGNGITPVRTLGDVLIQYDLSQGGTNPQLFLSRWVTSGPGSQCVSSNSTPCWGNTTASGLPPRVNLTAAGDATGSINTTAIPASESDGLGPISPRTFGEAQIDFDVFTGGGSVCVSFGSAYLKSRSSDSFTSALKDFIPPLALNFSNCGDLKIVKTDDATPGVPLAGATFNVLKDNAPTGTAPGAEDTFVDDCTTDANGECSFEDLLQGLYWVVETAAPPGHDLPSPAFQQVTVAVDTTVTVTFVNPRQLGAILITKTAKHAEATNGERPHAGVDFTVEGVTGTFTTGADGTVCVDGLLFGEYDVTETVPANYVAEGATTKAVTVDNKADCDDDPYGGETVSFVNTPLTDVTVSVDSLVPGGTASTIECDDPAQADGTKNGATVVPGGDGSLTVEDLPPGTYSCTVVIDP